MRAPGTYGAAAAKGGGPQASTVFATSRAPGTYGAAGGSKIGAGVRNGPVVAGGKPGPSR